MLHHQKEKRKTKKDEKRKEYYHEEKTRNKKRENGLSFPSLSPSSFPINREITQVSQRESGTTQIRRDSKNFITVTRFHHQNLGERVGIVPRKLFAGVWLPTCLH